MANLGKKNGVYLARFRLQGREYKKSLKTRDRKAAAAAMHRVEDALHRLGVNVLSLPPGVDPGDFVVSGGTLTASPATPPPRPAPSLDAVMTEYLANLGHLAESNRYTIAVHLRNLKKKLGDKVKGPIDQVTKADLQGFIQARLKERSRTTVGKERGTVVQFFRWAAGRQYLGDSPAAELEKLPASRKLAHFRTAEEIEAVLSRGGLTLAESWALWDGLYLTPDEIADLLAAMRRRARRDVSFLLHAIPAYTGMRRGELLRLRWVDVEFEQASLIARSRKQSRSVEETTRRIDLHPELKSALLDWQNKRPCGQYVVCDAGSLEPLTPKEANTRFWQPMRGTKWCLSSRRNRFKVGFHTYRHSFASNLAALGVDQRIIDEWMGHQTKEMRKRDRHLFPKNRRSAIESFSFAGGEASPGLP
jgi:integrase